jgi:hypothetical protein
VYRPANGGEAGRRAKHAFSFAFDLRNWLQIMAAVVPEPWPLG